MEKQTIEDLLDIINIKIDSSGYKYWTEAILQQMENPIEKISELYNLIAKKSNANRGSVERSMRTAYEKNKDIIKEYFNVNYKITNKTLLALLVREVQRIIKWGS